LYTDPNPFALGSIDNHSDVDTTTTAPTNNQVLSWNGASWVPANATVNTDDQNIQNLGLAGDTLTVGIEDGTSQTVSLAQYALDTDLHNAVTIAAGRDYITLLNQELTLGVVDISDDTNLAVGTGLSLIGDTVSLNSGIDNLTDVDTTTTAPGNGDMLSWDGANWVTTSATNYTDNIYIADGALTANRTVDLNGNNLFFSGAGNIGIGTTSPVNKLQVNGNVRAIRVVSSNGTAGSPAFRFDSDSDTGMFRGATNQLAFTTGGSERVRIDNNGRMGIGTSSPDMMLQVSGDAHINKNLQVDDSEIIYSEHSYTDSALGYELVWNLLQTERTNDPNDRDFATITSGTGWKQGFPLTRWKIGDEATNGKHYGYVGYFPGDAWHPLFRINTGGDETDLAIGVGTKDVINITNSDFYVGIQTDSPTQILDISGNMRLRNSFYDGNNQPGTAGQILSTTVAGTDWIDAPTSASGSIDTHSDVDTTTAAPSNGQVLTWDNANSEWVPQNTATHTGTTGSIFFAGATGTPTEDNNQLFWDNGNNRLGVGTASPSAKIDVQGQIVGGFGAQTTGGTLDWDDTSNIISGNGYSLLHGSATNGPGSTAYFHPFNFEYSSKNGSGNITQFAIPYGDSASMIRGMYMRGKYSGSWTNWMKIISENNSGDVGIGTTSPTQQLHVSGNIRITGLLYDGNNQPGTAGQLLSSTPTGTDWIDASTVGTDSQTLSFTNPNISISGGNSVDISGIDTDTTYTAGTSLSLTGTIFSVANGGITETQLNTSVAGNGLTGGGGTALAVGAGDGIIVNANDLTIDVITTGTTTTTSSNSGLEISADGLRMIGGCSDGEYLSWNATTSNWECQAVQQSEIVAYGKVAADGTELDVNGANITYNSTGDYTVTLDTALSTANYTVQLTVNEPAATIDDVEITIDNQTTSSFDVDITEQDNGTTAGARRDKVWHFVVIADSGSITNLSIDNDTLGGLACADGEVAKWNAGAGAWQCSSDAGIASAYDVYDNAGGQSPGASIATVNLDTVRQSNSNYSLATDEITVNSDGLYEVTFTGSADDTNGTRSTTAWFLEDNSGGAFTEVDGSRCFTYQRTTADGENSCSRTVILNLNTNNVIRLRMDVLDNNAGVTTLADGSSITIKKFIESGADYAEVYYTNDNNLEAGDIVMIDPDLSAGVKKSEEGYTPMGIVSTNPGKTIGAGNDWNGGRPVPIALFGRVPVKVDPNSDIIKTGDKLALAANGLAKKYQENDKYIIGIAMGDYNPQEQTSNSIQTVKVFIQIQAGVLEKETLGINKLLKNSLDNIDFDTLELKDILEVTANSKEKSWYTDVISAVVKSIITLANKIEILWRDVVDNTKRIDKINKENNLLKEELCKNNNAYSWCEKDDDFEEKIAENNKVEKEEYNNDRNEIIDELTDLTEKILEEIEEQNSRIDELEKDDLETEIDITNVKK
jgi:hypothetical protein